ncbi:hypothetical protein KIN20_021160 [Parelaphostrongylus tenuis]|uniref:Uncharacterized protein n=1 Tax=Parelaphostrongylus tenuis TaxID=148309 RepID=A0AAD5QUA6_PARTN|nr:hypothetical protein KIN20_021160 [Parelaphostrongylus tenuis]
MIEGNVNLKNTKQEGKAVEEKQMEEVVETDAESIQEVNGTDDTCDTEMERESLNDVEDGRDSEKLSPARMEEWLGTLPHTRYHRFVGAAIAHKDFYFAQVDQFVIRLLEEECSRLYTSVGHR